MAYGESLQRGIEAMSWKDKNLIGPDPPKLWETIKCENRCGDISTPVLAFDGSDESVFAFGYAPEEGVLCPPRGRKTVNFAPSVSDGSISIRPL